MKTFNEFEEQVVIPKITEQFRESPEGVTVDFIHSALFMHGVVVHRERVERILDELSAANLCERQEEPDVTFYIPNAHLYSPALVS